MSTIYCLSIIVYGLGTNPNHRSHWAFAFHELGASDGHIYHVVLLDLASLRYQFESRLSVWLLSRSSEGSFLVSRLNRQQLNEAMRHIQAERAPSNGRDRCQDWIIECLITREAEEVIEPGTSEWVEGLVGLSAAEVARRVGSRWTHA